MSRAARQVVERVQESLKAWVSPGGDVVKVDHHSSWEHRGRVYRYGVDDISGWVRVAADGNDLMVHGPLLNNAQRRALIDFAAEQGMRLVDTSAETVNGGMSRRVIEATCP